MQEIILTLIGQKAMTETAVGAVVVKFLVVGIRKAFPKIDANWVHLVVFGLSVVIVSAVTDWSVFDTTQYLTQIGATAVAAVGVNEVTKNKKRRKRELQ